VLPLLCHDQISGLKMHFLCFRSQRQPPLISELSILLPLSHLMRYASDFMCWAVNWLPTASRNYRKWNKCYTQDSFKSKHFTTLSTAAFWAEGSGGGACEKAKWNRKEDRMTRLHFKLFGRLVVISLVFKEGIKLNGWPYFVVTVHKLI